MSRYFLDSKRFALADDFAVSVEERVNRTSDASSCSFVYLLLRSFDDGIDILRVAGHLSVLPPSLVSWSLHTLIGGVPG